MGRFLRVLPQPHRTITLDEQAQVLAAFKRVWPSSRVTWTVDEAGLLGNGGTSFSGRPSAQCCQMLYVGLNGQREPITDQEAVNLIAAELRKEFPDIQI
jgi:hypothetical protein